MTPWDFVILALAGYRATRFIVEDHIFSPIREWIWSKYPPESTKLGFLLTCYWCSGFWVALLFVVMYLLLPGPILVVGYILAISLVIGLIDTWMQRQG